MWKVKDSFNYTSYGDDFAPTDEKTHTDTHKHVRTKTHSCFYKAKVHRGTYANVIEYFFLLRP